MKLAGNTILITGGGSGIGRGLAAAFHALGNTVVIAGRRKSALETTLAAFPGMTAFQLDIADPALIMHFADRIAKDYPALNVVINNAGIMRREKLAAESGDLADMEAIVSTNLLGPMRLTALLLPALLKQPSATIINVSSGLAFLPLAMTPAYCATKAAIHSYTQSLRYQLRNTPIQVMELAPPYVATDIMDGADDPRAMPLDAFIAEVMAILTETPDIDEILVKNVQPLRFAERNGVFEQAFVGLNEAMGEGM